jgi:pimeloyl-ACP methyl ester carboxylesterase
MEPRFKTAVLVAGGMPAPTTPPSIDPVHYVPRIRIPVVMINGRFDYIFPMAGNQVPLFELLGSPAPDKRHVRIDSGHVVPRSHVLRESLVWLDKYLGPVP